MRIRILPWNRSYKAACPCHLANISMWASVTWGPSLPTATIRVGAKVPEKIQVSPPPGVPARLVHHLQDCGPTSCAILCAREALQASQPLASFLFRPHQRWEEVDTFGSSFDKTLTLPLNRTVPEIVMSGDRHWVPPLFSTHLQILARDAAAKGVSQQA